jgi:hypothetical protein
MDAQCRIWLTGGSCLLLSKLGRGCGPVDSNEVLNPEKKTEAAPPDTLWLAAGLAGVAVRLLLWWFSIGSNDVVLWRLHGLHVFTGGLASTYRNYPDFNHPPLMGLYAGQAWKWSGGALWTFARLIKLPGLAGEGLALWALWRFAGRRAFVVYAWLPAAILVSGFHGNTDSLYAAVVLVAAIAFDRGKYFLSGVLWSAALNVKLLPLALLPLVFLGAPSAGALLRPAAGFTLGMAPFLPPALAAGEAMRHNMLDYNSRPDNWGLMALLNGGIAIPGLRWAVAPARDLWLATGRYAILLGVAAVALLSRFRRRIPMTEQAALGAALFLVLAPGFGVQYVMFAAPLLCIADLRHAVWWGCASGVFLAAVYSAFLVSRMPLQSFLLGNYPLPASMLGMLAWAVLVHFIWDRLRVVTCAQR